MKDDQVENAKSELELRILIHFPWKAYESDADCVPPKLGNEKI